jgi:cGMP-dependent protein kinase 2
LTGFRYGKPGQVTVRAVTDGCLWVLEKGAFHGVLVMNQVHRPSLKKFRSVEIFSKLSLSHLHNLVDALTDVTFADGEIIVRKVCFSSVSPSLLIFLVNFAQ